LSTAKRVYFYLVYTITLGVFAAGAGILLDVVCDGIIGSALVQVGAKSFSLETLSLGMAMLVIGGVLWYLFWRAIRRNVGTDAGEIGSAVRKFFLNLILVVSALVGLFGAVDFLAFLIGGDVLRQFSSDGLARVIVTGVVWYYHWRLNESEGQPSSTALTLRRWQVYFLASWGLIALSISLVVFVNAAVRQLPVWGGAVISGGFWNTGVRSSLGWVVFSGVLWGFYWLRMARGDAESNLRQVYLWLICIAGGTIAGVVAFTRSLWGVFQAVFGLSNPGHFIFLGWTVPLMLISVAIWVYHRRVTQEEAVRAKERRLSARRVHFYIMSFLGLAVLISGLTLLFGVLIELLINALGTQTVLVTPGWWRDQISGCLALLIAGAPLWMFYWDRVLQIVTAGGLAERTARSRRIFLYVLLGAAIVALAADLVNIIYQMLSGALQGSFDVMVLRRSKWSLQTIFIAVPLLWYFWGVIRQDQHLGAEAAVRKTIIVLVPEPAEGLVNRLEEKLGYRVKTVYYLGQVGELPEINDEELDRLVARIQAADGAKVVLLPAAGTLTVHPYRVR
jgi:hypothetical protein